MMKKIVIALAVLISVTVLHAQQFEVKLNEASVAYSNGNLENARFALQEALYEINQAIGREILEVLPISLNGLDKVEQSDEVTGTGYGFAGLYVNREYQGDEMSASVQIISDSPLLAGINALMNMPVFIGGGSGQKRIKIENYNALLTKNQDDKDIVSWDLQIPFSNSLMTFSCKGVSTEKEFISLANKLEIARIVKIAE